MKLHLTLALITATLLTSAQHRFSSDDFLTSNYDLQINEFPQDSTASAVVIFEEGNSYVDKNTYDLKTDIKRKIKILDKDKTDKATVQIYLYRSKKNREKVSNIKATTYNLNNGNIVKTPLKQSDVYLEDYNANYQIVKFTMPNIMDGSVITYSYTITSPYMGKYRGWKFQSDIPKLTSIYHTSIPGNWDYHIKLTGYKDLDINKQNGKSQCLKFGLGGYADCTIATYGMKDIPAFVEEDFMTTRDNYESGIEYELKKFTNADGSVKRYTRNWTDVDKQFKKDESIGKQLSKTSLVKNLINPSEISGKTNLEKAQHIYKYVQDNFSWNESFRIFNGVEVKDIIKNKSGSVGEVNILLHNLLDYHGIDVKPVLLSTRENGFATKLYPVLTDFNYVIVKAAIEGKNYLLDATGDYLSFGEIPFRCLNHYGRELDFKNGSKWIDIKAGKPSNTSHRVQLKLEDDILSGNIQSKYSGYHSFGRKSTFYTDPDKYIEDFESANAIFEVVDHEVLSNGLADEKFEETFNIEYSDVSTIGDEIILNPFIYKFFTKNPFTLQQRTYPIDFGYPDNYLYSMKLDMGGDYELKELPEPINISLPNNSGGLLYSVKQQDNSVLIYFKLSWKESYYSIEYYEYLKSLMSTVVDVLTNTSLVLKRK